MKALIEKITGGFSASAKVVDGTLILSLPDAIDPVVWRMDLGHVRASAIEVRSQDDGSFMLTLKTPKGDVNDIAPYATRSRAVGALVAISRAMEQARGEIRATGPGHAANDTAAAYVAPKEDGFTAGRLLAGIIGLILVVGLISLMVRMSPAPENISPAGGAGEHMPALGETPAGEAVSADDFLRNR